MFKMWMKKKVILKENYILEIYNFIYWGNIKQMSEINNPN